MGTIWTIAAKDLRVMARDRAGLFWVIGYPIIFALFFGYLYSGLMGGGGGGISAMPIAVVDHDGSPDATALIAKLQDNEALDVATDLSFDEAQDRVRRGRLAAYVVIEPGFGESWALMTGGDLPFTIGKDPSRGAEGAMLRGTLMEATAAVLRDRFTDRDRIHDEITGWQNEVRADESTDPVQRTILLTFLGALDTFALSSDAGLFGAAQPPPAPADTSEADPGPAETADPAAPTDTPTPTPTSPAAAPAAAVASEDVERERKAAFSSFEITFPSAILWALMGCTATFAISIVNERNAGTFQRLRLAPITRGQILAGKGLGCFLAGLAVATLLIGLGVGVWGVRVASPITLVVALVCTAFAFTGLMMVFSVAGKTETAVAGAGWATLLICAMIGGGMIPLVFMPTWLRSVSHVSPIKWGIVALEGATWRQFSLTEFDMLLPCGILLGVGVVGYAVGTFVLTRQDA